MTGKATGIRCPACPETYLQPLTPGSRYLDTAKAHAISVGVDIPWHGPAQLVMFALVSHAMILHDDLDLAEYLEAYLSH